MNSLVFVVFFSIFRIFTIFVFFQIYVDDSACINKTWHKAAGIDDCFVVATKGEFTLPETNSSHLKIDGWMTSISFWVSAYFQVLWVLGDVDPQENTFM